MIAFLSVTDNPPPLDVPVLVAWEKYPWDKEGKPHVAHQAYKLVDCGDILLWHAMDALEDPAEWDDHELPTHWAPFPEFSTKQSEEETRI